MKDVLLTGAAGFIGHHCIEALLNKNYTVHAVSSRRRRNHSAQRVSWHHADLHNREHVLKLISRVQPEYLLHLAWDVTPGIYWNSMENLHWVKSSIGLLQTFIDGGGKRAVMVGSCAEYDWSYGYCRELVTPLNPKTLYGVCKNALQSILAAVNTETGFSTAWGRLFFLYGAGEHTDRLVAELISKLLQGREVLCTSGVQIRDYLYVKDAAAALTALLDCEITGPVNVASGIPVRLKDLINGVAEIIGKPELVKLGALQTAKDDPPFLAADTARLNDQVGWQPTYDLTAGLQETVQWWLKQPEIKK